DYGQGGDVSRYQLSGDVESRSGATVFRQHLFWLTGGMRLRENFTGFLVDTQSPLQPLHEQRGDLLDLNDEHTTFGARGSMRARAGARGSNQEVELGYFARGDRVRSTQQRIEAATGVPYKLETDLDSLLGDMGLYGDVGLHPTGWLTIRGGARA